MGEYVLLVLLCVLILVWASRYVETYLIFKRDPHIDPEPVTPLPDNLPRVSVLIPARNEEDNLEECLRSILNQSYPDYEVLVIDDRSTDGTADLVRQLQSNDDRIRLIQIEELPAGWAGKTHALYRGSRDAHGEYLIFTDADTLHSTHSIVRLVKYMMDNDVDMLSIVPRPRNETFWEHVLQPAAGCTILAWFPMKKVNDPKSRVAFANGQLIVMKRGTYEEIGGHEAVKGALLEDVALAKLVKSRGFKLHFVYALKLMKTRMYSDLAGIWRGWRRIFTDAMERKLWMILCITAAVVMLSVMPAFLLVVCIAMVMFAGATTLHLVLLCLAAGSYLLMSAVMARAWVISGVHPKYVALYPLGACMVAGILVDTALAVVMRRDITWRGTRYSSGKVTL